MRRAGVLRPIVWLPAIMLAAYLLLLGGVRAAGVLGLPHQVEYGEGPVLDWARQISTGALPYKPIATPPYNFSVYTPLYLALSAIFIALVPENPYLGGRLLSLFSALGLTLLLWAATDRQESGSATTDPERDRLAGRDSLLAGAALLFWIVSPYVFRWATFYRPDMLALFWSGLGMALVSRGANRAARNDVAAALCFVLAFFTKQSFFAAPVAAMLYLVATKQNARAWRMGWTGVAAAGATALALYSLAGVALTDNLIAANANAFSWEAVRRFWWSFLNIAPVVMLTALYAALRRGNALWAFYLLITLIVSLSIGKAGAWENYFLEPLWAMCVLVGRSKRPRAGSESGAGSAVIAVAVAVQLWSFSQAYERIAIRDEVTWLRTVRDEGVALREAVNAVPADTRIYSEPMGVLAEAGRPVPLHSFVYTQLERQGLWDDEPLVERFRNSDGIVIQRFDAPGDPLQLDRYTRAMLDGIERGYGFGAQIGEWVVRPATAAEVFTHADDPVPLDNGLLLLNWSAEPCAPGQRCVTGSRPVELWGGDDLTIRTLWQGTEALPPDLRSSVKLFDESGELFAQQDGAFRNGWMGRGWTAGAILRDAPRTLTLPEALEEGAYTVEVTLYQENGAAPLAVARLPFFKVPGDEVPDEDGAAPLAVFDGRFALVTQPALPERVRTGEALDLDLTYEGVAWRPERLTTFLHLASPDGSVAAQADFEPEYPPAVWSEGERVRVSYRLTVPEQVPVGEYRLLAGWYDSATGERLPVEGGGDVVELGMVTVSR